MKINLNTNAYKFIELYRMTKRLTSYVLISNKRMSSVDRLPIPIIKVHVNWGFL